MFFHMPSWSLLSKNPHIFVCVANSGCIDSKAEYIADCSRTLCKAVVCGMVYSVGGQDPTVFLRDVAVCSSIFSTCFCQAHCYSWGFKRECSSEQSPVDWSLKPSRVSLGFVSCSQEQCCLGCYLCILPTSPHVPPPKNGLEILRFWGSGGVLQVTVKLFTSLHAATESTVMFGPDKV